VPGTALPSSRTLSRDLGVARGTVVDAYSQLVAEGYLLTRPGASTVVASVPRPAGTRPSIGDAAAVARINLRPGLLDLGTSFPRRLWLQAVRSVLGAAPDSAFDYGDPRGRIELRQALAAYLGRARGVVTSPDRILVCSGFSHGLTLVASALRDGGTRAMAMENPCLPRHRHLVSRHGLAVVALPVDHGGARMDALDGLDAQAALVTPAHQYPTGVTLRPERRAALVRWAQDRDGVVIEDDYDAEFRYDRQPVGAVQGLDPDRVIYGGTVSKTLGPGIRLGWLVLPARLVEPIVEAHRHTASFPAALEQLALAELLGSARLDRHLRRLRAIYRPRRDQVVTAVCGAMPSLRPSGIAAGLHLLLELPSGGPTEDDVEAAADRRRVALEFLGPHWHRHGNPTQGVIVGYSSPPAHAFAEAVDELVAVFGDAQASGADAALPPRGG